MNLRRSDGSVTRVQAHLQAVRWDEQREWRTGPAAGIVAPNPDNRVISMPSERQLLQTRIDELNAILDTATDGVILLNSVGRIRSDQSFRRCAFWL